MSDVKIQSVGVCGAGTMGSGIAQLFAQYGFRTFLYDINFQLAEKACEAILKNWNQLAEKGKITAEQHLRAQQNLSVAKDLSTLECDLVIEAIVEDSKVKHELYQALTAFLPDNAIIATNTSSLSVSALAFGVKHPERFAGMHFFNPAPIMKLVEIVKGAATSNNTVHALAELSRLVGKIPVICKDSPGFIVNRVARHFYTESLKIYEEQVASFANIDTLLESAGFKMGPFKLMDTIGNDINYKVTCSLYEAFHQEPRFRPSRIQQQLVQSGRLGKKTGKGFYDY